MAAPDTRYIRAFPFLTVDEFHRACRFFRDKIQGVESRDGLGLSSIRFVEDGPILKISRSIENIDTRGENDEDAESHEPGLDDLEDDPEAMIRTTNTNPSLQVEYDIILSPSYQVPVLYFTLHEGNDKKPVDLDTVYQYLVPEGYRKELGSVGVMGGISIGYHPGSGAPAFFVHPCNTAEAMTQIAGWQSITPERYLLIWLGLVGNCVGLRVPHEPFASEVMQDPKVPLT